MELAVEKMKAAALKSYGAKGQDVVDKNYAAIDRSGEYVQLTVKPEWARSAQRDASLVEEPACRRGEAGRRSRIREGARSSYPLGIPKGDACYQRDARTLRPVTC